MLGSTTKTQHLDQLGEPQQESDTESQSAQNKSTIVPTPHRGAGPVCANPCERPPRLFGRFPQVISRSLQSRAGCLLHGLLHRLSSRARQREARCGNCERCGCVATEMRMCISDVHLSGYMIISFAASKAAAWAGKNVSGETAVAAQVRVATAACTGVGTAGSVQRRGSCNARRTSPPHKTQKTR